MGWADLGGQRGLGSPPQPMLSYALSKDGAGEHVFSRGQALPRRRSHPELRAPPPGTPSSCAPGLPSASVSCVTPETSFLCADPTLWCPVPKCRAILGETRLQHMEELGHLPFPREAGLAGAGDCVLLGGDSGGVRACLRHAGLHCGRDTCQVSFEACHLGWASPEQAQDGRGDQKGGEGQAITDGVAGLHRTVEHGLLLLEGQGEALGWWGGRLI